MVLLLGIRDSISRSSSPLPWLWAWLWALLVTASCSLALGTLAPLPILVGLVGFRWTEGRPVLSSPTWGALGFRWGARLGVLATSCYLVALTAGSIRLAGLWAVPWRPRVLVVVAGWVLAALVGNQPITCLLDSLTGPSADGGLEIGEYQRKTSAMVGRMERTLVFLFVLSGWFDGIGYLLAAKSVLRFSDIRQRQELHYTECVIAGTFASFAWAFGIVRLTQLMLPLS